MTMVFEEIDVTKETIPKIELPPAIIPPSDAECALIAILQDQSGLELAEFCWVDDNRREGDEEGGGDPCYRAYPYQWPWWRDRSKKSVDQGARCVREGHLILTGGGLVPIEQVRVGDLVLTHRNRWRPVTAVWNRGVKEAVAVRGHGLPKSEPLVVTPDHKLWARHVRRASKPRDGHKGKKMLDPGWIAAEDFLAPDGSGQMHTSWSSPAGRLPGIAMPGLAEPAKKGRFSNTVEDLTSLPWLWLYGLFLAEGSTYFDQQYSRACWSVHDDEVAEVTAMLNEVGLSYQLDNSCDGAATVIRVSSKPIALWLRAQGGHLAHGKEVAPWVYGLPAEKRQAVLDGVLYGDGHTRPSGRIELNTVSKKLAISVRILAQTVGRSAAMHVAHRPPSRINGRLIAQRRPVYTVSVDQPSPRRRTVVIEDGSAWTQATVEPAKPAQMWDLTVAEDNSFIADGVKVHNSTGKSESIMAQACAFPWNFPDQEFVIVAPEGNHVDTITDRIENRILAVRLLREQLAASGSRRGITHHPFAARFSSGAKVFSRLPQKTGLGIKGIHPAVLHVDEGQDISEATWKEMPEVVRTDLEGSRWCVHGVSKGVRGDTFWDITLPSSEWTVHRPTALHRPNWNEKERQERIDFYGGEHSPDFKRNVYGEHGDAMNRIFDLQQLQACRDDQQGSDYNLYEYAKIVVYSEEIAARAHDVTGREHDVEVFDDIQLAELISFIDGQLPATHNRYKDFPWWFGMDVGIVGDPSEILAFVEYEPDKDERIANRRSEIAVPDKGLTRFKCMLRIQLNSLEPEMQARLIIWLLDRYAPRVFAMDRTGNGIGIYRALQRLAGHRRDYIVQEVGGDLPLTQAQRDAKQKITAIKGYPFGGKVPVEIDWDRVEELKLTDPKEILEKATITKTVKDAGTDILRDFVAQRRLLLPFDQEIVSQWNAQTWKHGVEPVDAYGNRQATYLKGEFHILDAGRMFAMAVHQVPMDELVAETLKPRPDRYDHFGL